MTHRTHTPKTVRRALDDGNTAFALLTGDESKDDVLIGSRKEVEKQVLAAFDLEEFPEGFRLQSVTVADFEAETAKADVEAKEIGIRHRERMAEQSRGE